MIIRPARAMDAPAIAQVHVASWRTTYRGIVPAAYLAELPPEPRERYWATVIDTPDADEFVFVAEDEDGTIAGFATGGPERSHDPVYRGELYAIYLLAERQQQGTGRLLMEAVMARLARLGYSRMLLWVLAGNPARGFYERMGGVLLRSQPVIIGGARLEEIAFGWRLNTAPQD